MKLILTVLQPQARHCVSKRRNPIVNEASLLRDLVVKQASGLVAFLRQPVHAVGGARLGKVDHGLDQLAPDMLAAQVRRDEQVLQVAVVPKSPGGRVEQAVHDPNGQPIGLRDEAMHVELRVAQSLPGQLGLLLLERTLVVVKVGSPVRQPLRIVLAGQGTDLSFHW